MAWLKPQTLEQAVEWLDGHRPKIVCGGTDLFVNWQRKRDVFPPDANWLDISRIPDLRRIVRTAEGLEIGAAVTAAEIWQLPAFEVVPALQQAAKIVGGWQIQNRASLGGNIANASPAADMIIPLAAYQAVVRVAGKNGIRAVPLGELIVGPRKTTVAEDEMIESILIPQRFLGVPQTFLRHDQRGATDISIISVAVTLSGTKDRIEWGTAAVGAANPAPLTLPDIDADWPGALTPEKVERIAAAYADRSQPITDVRAGADYRRAMVKVYVKRAVAALFPDQHV